MECDGPAPAPAGVREKPHEGSLAAHSYRRAGTPEQRTRDVEPLRSARQPESSSRRVAPCRTRRSPHRLFVHSAVVVASACTDHLLPPLTRPSTPCDLLLGNSSSLLSLSSTISPHPLPLVLPCPGLPPALLNLPQSARLLCWVRVVQEPRQRRWEAKTAQDAQKPSSDPSHPPSYRLAPKQTPVRPPRAAHTGRVRPAAERRTPTSHSE